MCYNSKGFGPLRGGNVNGYNGHVFGPHDGFEKRRRSLSRRFVPALVGLALVATAAKAQFAISPRAGLVHYLEGRVMVEGQELGEDTAQFRDPS